MHYYKFNIADWYLSTSHLSLIEESIYFRLINHYYDTEGFIPLETQSVIRRLRMETHEETVLAILGEFFTLTEKGFVHKRCEGMLKEYRKTKNKNRVNGAKGGRPRKGEASSVSQNKPTGNPDGSQVEPKHNLNQEPLTTNHKPVTKFKPPSVDQVEKYCKERNNGINPESFINYYQTNGWMRGKNKIKDWKACVRTWEARTEPPPNNEPPRRPNLLETMQ